MTYEQCSTLEAIESIQYIHPRTNRVRKISKGKRLWVATSQCFQNQSGTCELCDLNKPMGTGVYLTLEQIQQYFSGVR